MRRTAFVLLLILVWPCDAAAPKAVVKAPPSVQAGSLVMPDTSGTVSDAPVDIIAFPSGPGDGPEYAVDGSLLGWRLVAPGPITFFVTASGVPPGSNLRLTAVGAATVNVIPAGKPVVPPTKPPVVVPSDPLSSAAVVYIKGIPAGLRQTAADVRSRSVKTIEQMNVANTNRRKATGQALASEWDGRFKSMVDSMGNISDTEGVAAALEAAAAAQEAVLSP